MHRRWLGPVLLAGVTALLATALGVAVAPAHPAGPGAATAVALDVPPPPPSPGPDISSAEYIKAHPPQDG